jgi:hypothetical protein
MAYHSELLPWPELAIARSHGRSSGKSIPLLDVAGARVLINKVVSNQSWKIDRQPAHAKGIHEIDSVDRLVAKMDLLIKKLESPHQDVN